MMDRSEIRKIIFEEIKSILRDDAIFKDRDIPGIQPVRDEPGDSSHYLSSLEVDRVQPDDQGRMLDYGKSKSGTGEGKSVKSNLYRLISDSLMLYDSLEDGDDIPEWIESNIATAQDRVQTAYNYMDFRIHRYMMKE